MDNINLENNIYSLGLIGSGIGVWWIKKENGKFIYYHTESSSAIYGKNIKKLPPAEVYGNEWKSLSEIVFRLNSTYKNIILNTKRKLNDLLDGKTTTCSYNSPWIDKNNNEMWVMDKVFLVDRAEDGTAQTVIGVSINESSRLSTIEKYQAIEEINVKLRNANERAIDLANLLVWSMNYEEYPEGDHIFCNDLYSDTLGLEKSKDGYIKIADFLKTEINDPGCPGSLEVLLDEFEKAKRNKTDEFLGIHCKHINLKTGLPVYLNHYARVGERYPNGTLKRISGYIYDITNRVKIEKENEELDKKNKELLLSQKLAVSSGKVMIWYQNSEDNFGVRYFYGNDNLIEKLGLTKHPQNRFSIDDFNDAIYTGDEEGKNLKEQYLKIDDLIEENVLQSYSKVLVKHQNLKTKKIYYFEHNLIVEERYEDNSLKIRGGLLSDITTETVYRKRIEFLVKHDLVTNLSNRNMFEIYIKSPEFPKSYSLIVIDIDGLKFINDAFGHMNGDKVIKLLAKILNDEFKANSSIFRIGGDEFTIITNEINQNIIEQKIENIKRTVIEKSSKIKLAFNVSVGFEIVTNNDIKFDNAFTTAENIMYRRKLSVRNSRKSHTLETVLETLNTKTEDTKAHCDRIGEFAVMILKELGFTRISDLEDITLLCQVHDVGKITISEELLSKPEKLTEEEFIKIKGHSEAGYKIIRNIVESDNIADGVLYHHERQDGKGYPFGLEGHEIPLFAKIVSVCDAYDVMISGRTYQTKKTHNEAIKEIKKYSGTQFDPVIVEAFIKAYQKNKLK